jgi:hypothetical protein
VDERRSARYTTLDRFDIQERDKIGGQRTGVSIRKSAHVESRVVYGLVLLETARTHGDGGVDMIDHKKPNRRATRCTQRIG